jgi:UDP-N-acetylmuramoyl-L-alanyl-D-glutamate--2,6-diaminopimelate ligase
MNNIVIQNISLDSRQAQPGDLFIALKGFTVDGRHYIEKAVEKGVAAILVEANDVNDKASPRGWLNNSLGQKIPLIPCSHLKALSGVIAARFFNEPSKELSVIGITGTNGKTSTSHYIAALLESVGETCGIIGTLGAGFLQALKETGCTTPDAVQNQRQLAEFFQKKASVVAMEVTSHALDQERLAGIQFQTAILTNLTRDHLDYHQDIEDYWTAKQKLFLQYKPKNSIINLDDEYGRGLYEDLISKKIAGNVIGFTVQDYPNFSNIVSAKKIKYHSRGMEALIETPWGIGELKTTLVGQFNLSNLLAAIAAVCLQGISLQKVLASVPSIKPVSGRMMRLGGQNSLPLVLVDYAHTPDALTKVLEAVRVHCRGKVWCVFGCGGDRDRGKRPLMAAAVEQLSDYIYVTQDNPRTENPQQIIEDILKGFKETTEVVVEPDRSQAIQAAIALASAEDCVVVAGKGHEPYQIIGIEKKPFLDQTEVEHALDRRA